MNDSNDRAPLENDREGPLADKGWHAGATFFEESGGQPANSGDQRPESGDGADGGDVHKPASEADTAPLKDEEQGEPQSWPGRSFGSIPPPG